MGNKDLQWLYNNAILPCDHLNLQHFIFPQYSIKSRQILPSVPQEQGPVRRREQLHLILLYGNIMLGIQFNRLFHILCITVMHAITIALGVVSVSNIYNVCRHLHTNLCINQFIIMDIRDQQIKFQKKQYLEMCQLDKILGSYYQDSGPPPCKFS